MHTHTYVYIHMLFAALTNSVCLNNASFFFLFKYFLCQGYELSGEIALKNNHYYYYYYYYNIYICIYIYTYIMIWLCIHVANVCMWWLCINVAAVYQCGKCIYMWQSGESKGFHSVGLQVYLLHGVAAPYVGPGGRPCFSASCHLFWSPRVDKQTT